MRHVGSDDPKAKKPSLSTVLRVFAYVQRYPWMATGTIASAMLTTLLVVVFPTVTQQIIDKVIIGKQPALLLPLVLTGLGAFF